MQVCIETVEGQHFNVYTSRYEKVSNLKESIFVIGGTAPEEQRLWFEERELEDDQTLQLYGVGNKATLRLTEPHRPWQEILDATNNSFVDKNFRDPLIQYMMQSEEYRAFRTIPLTELRMRVKACGARPSATFHFERDCNIIHGSQRRVLCLFLDFMWEKTKIIRSNRRGALDNRHVDMRLDVSDAELLRLLRSRDEFVLDANRKSHMILMKLKQLYYNVPGASAEQGPKIVLRTTRGPTLACINFHCDNPQHATSTSEIPLNEEHEYQGGQVCYFINDSITSPPRFAGSLTQHSPYVLHGVTSVTRGTRVSLLVLDQRNNCASEGVTVVSAEDVSDWLDTQGGLSTARGTSLVPATATVPKVSAATAPPPPGPIVNQQMPRPQKQDQSCVVCLDEEADHVLIPCGHVCMCKTCQVSVCPLCRSNVHSKLRVFL